MSVGLTRILERTRQIRDARALLIAERLANAAGTDRQQTGKLVTGVRVFDTVTGEEGVIVHAARENIIVPTP